MRVLIKNGIVVNADGQAKQDLLIESGIVRQLGTDISPQLPCEEIDASGCYVFPGGVDVHTHFNIDVGIARSCDDFFTGTRAAACGGTTTIIDHMGFGPNGCRLRHQLEVYRGYAAHKADAPRDKCTLSCAINGIHAAFHYLKKNYISGCVMTVPTG